MIIQAALLGLLGGIARSCVGLLKASRTKVKIKWKKFFISLICSAIIGATAGILFFEDYRFSVIAGYAGTDLLENIYKITFKKKQL